MGSAGQRYLAEADRLLRAAADSQAGAITRAAVLVADALASGGLLHTFGTGHSHLLAEEVFYRAGGLAAVNPILVDPLMLHSGAVRSTSLERLSGVGELLLDAEPASAGDVLLVISNSGGNAVAVEMAQAAARRGLATIALTSVRHATDSAARAGSGSPRLHELADVVLDNGGRPGDACVELADLVVAPTSTVVGAALLQAVVAEAVELLLARGVTPEVFRSSNLAGGDAHNSELARRYAGRVRSL